MPPELWWALINQASVRRVDRPVPGVRRPQRKGSNSESAAAVSQTGGVGTDAGVAMRSGRHQRNKWQFRKAQWSTPRQRVDRRTSGLVGVGVVWGGQGARQVFRLRQLIFSPVFN